MNALQSSIIWLGMANLLGFGISAIFSGKIKLSRRFFLLPYVILTSIFLYFYFESNSLISKEFWTHNWIYGLLAGLVIGLILMKNILSQPYSQKNKGLMLFFDIIWLGVIYGVIDGLFLNVMPVKAVYIMFGTTTFGNSSIGVIIIGIFALISSLLITFLYHIGYKEFRNNSVMLVLLGNTLITLAFIISGNPLGAVISHTIMHIAAVFRGPDTTLQLPPHY
ncbi:MAG: hypothetical protein A2X19_09625 [Bacteroidetes bacterium GWE2_39_28]|nr:MAG: hypothetical protein A2X19_09625 [Bacteroidetes bacterium GWE2_39_28]OFY12352.1 MAG: hypothetical protein A2X16_07140 [Bacteroidetes bacterium GWF2_39_10]OFZ08840.1 MAG: hypothetical protein A2322_07575 [Bacteroidetes bacterium RIFOXYB2_FULL_39_7]OFZ12002.1 MAG: hypothetical protein A2465_08610 [Bacteroidetes bacterium RIFOXYC2_FULL_39_11]HCT95015.1 hypothetical protein [Rikenellaceae bacterium]